MLSIRPWPGSICRPGAAQVQQSECHVGMQQRRTTVQGEALQASLLCRPAQHCQLFFLRCAAEPDQAEGAQLRADAAQPAGGGVQRGRKLSEGAEPRPKWQRAGVRAGAAGRAPPKASQAG